MIASTRTHSTDCTVLPIAYLTYRKGPLWTVANLDGHPSGWGGLPCLYYIYISSSSIITRCNILSLIGRNLTDISLQYLLFFNLIFFVCMLYVCYLISLPIANKFWWLFHLCIENNIEVVIQILFEIATTNSTTCKITLYLVTTCQNLLVDDIFFVKLKLFEG